MKNLDTLVKMDQINENQTIKNVLYRRKIRREKRITFAVVIVIGKRISVKFKFICIKIFIKKFNFQLVT